MSLAVGLAAPYGLAFTYFQIGFNPSSPGAIFFFLVLLVVNVLCSLVARHFTLSRADLVLVYCMLLMAVTTPTLGAHVLPHRHHGVSLLLRHAREPLRRAHPRSHPHVDRAAGLAVDHALLRGPPERRLHRLVRVARAAGLLVRPHHRHRIHARLRQFHPAPPVVGARTPQLPHDGAAEQDDRRRRGCSRRAGAPLPQRHHVGRLPDPRHLLQLYGTARVLSRRARVHFLAGNDHVVAQNDPPVHGLQFRLDRFLLPRQSADHFQHLVLLPVLQSRRRCVHLPRHQEHGVAERLR